MLDANSILNDPTYTPLATEAGNPFATNRGELGVFIVVRTTLRNRSPFGRIKYWLSSPVRLVRGGGRP